MISLGCGARTRVSLLACVLWSHMCAPAAGLAQGGHAADSVGAQAMSPITSLRLLALGDVNLGRLVGREILMGDTLYPFLRVRDTLATYDIVFANLESQLSDQGGETQDPRNNLVFTGPPAGAASLRRGGVTLVSTANNHALDYGVNGLRETIGYLRESGILFSGTADDEVDLYRPVVLSVHGIRVAMFACTALMNVPGSRWKRHVAAADTGHLLPAVRAIRDSVDFVIVSYHGGEEYADHPARQTRAFAHAVIRSGADLFLGHHPHVPYGIEEDGGKMIVYSLGNFVFRQPDRFWTQLSFAFAAQITKDSSGARMTSFRCIPLRSGLQPGFLNEGEDARNVIERIRSQSSEALSERIAW